MEAKWGWSGPPGRGYNSLLQVRASLPREVSHWAPGAGGTVHCWRQSLTWFWGPLASGVLQTDGLPGSLSLPPQVVSPTAPTPHCSLSGGSPNLPSAWLLSAPV